MDDRTLIYNWTGLHIIRMERTEIRGSTGYVRDAKYKMYTNGSVVDLPRVRFLISQGKFRTSVADQLGIVVPRIHREVWPHVAQALLNLCITVARGASTESATDAVARFTHSIIGTACSYDGCEATSSRRALPCVHRTADGDASVLITGAMFHVWLADNGIPAKSKRAACALLRKAGGKPTVVRIDKQHIVAAWRIPIREQGDTCSNTA